MEIDGRVEGEMAIDGIVSVGPEGSVRGPLRCGALVAQGECRGEVIAARSVHLRVGAAVEGDVQSPRIAIDDGARLEGAILMSFELEPRPAGPTRVEPDEE